MKSVLTLMAAAFLMVTLIAFQSRACPCDGKNQKTEQVSNAPMAFDKMPAVGTKATCPVSKHEFTVDKDTPKSEYKGKIYVFCCGGCKPKFDADPEKFLPKAK